MIDNLGVKRTKVMTSEDMGCLEGKRRPWDQIIHRKKRRISKTMPVRSKSKTTGSKTDLRPHCRKPSLAMLMCRYGTSPPVCLMCGFRQPTLATF
ncbi:hypothetical protein M758_4G014300 [Ceratodon purpureus]|uniref:Uncharacterized protein n=1 Tax=Ceratodon purpureus TaxID=3225 RepID=A0A8T0I766_CERPU|nr:hypothetical protein KC19_4G016000 [Ceratodon purpureus]KAG0617778.1 hypothetical protein M758_4G014300 [Ceratodon purpureus]